MGLSDRLCACRFCGMTNMSSTHAIEHEARISRAYELQDIGVPEDEIAGILDREGY